jgi:hypothetical protein
MGWLDNIFRRRQATTSSTQDMADAQKAQQKDAERETSRRVGREGSHVS